ncbi:receptor-like protein kinase 5 [Carex littledalei]|uniref:non-specific serine/threonine protein kinase n=1 Tax=Carex littledalei TaxID=544730 RepID=A0A833QTA5_9POAL|nr:receptor-like protein kinase 5 [Carex littledalei]
MKPHFISLLFLLISASFLLYSNCQGESDAQILLEIKATWGNPPALVSWNSTSGDHCTSWNGIYCTNGFVSEIIIINQNLNQPIPESICRLKNLSHLDLSDNELSGTFPEFLYNCSSLQYLNISQNYFVGVLPTNIDKLLPSSLTYLDLSGNNFTGDIPASIGLLVELKELHLEGNLFNGTYPREIANLNNLEHFSLAWNPFLKPAQIPHEFGNLTRLKSLWMTRTNTIGEIPITLSKLTELEHLDLGWNQINGTLPSWIWSLEKLQILYLYSNDLTGEISFTGPIRCLGLSELDLSANKLTGSIPDRFGVLKNLSTLFLYYNFLSGEIPTSIGFLPKLIDIRLFNNNLTGVLPESLGNYSSLWNLEVDDNRLSGQLPPHLCSGNNLVSIVVFDNNFTGEIPSSLADCYTLNSIQLHKNRFSGEFPSKIWSITNLTTILIHDNEFTGMLPKKLPWNLTRLEIYNNNFTGEIPSFADRLQVFKASNNSFYGELPSNFTGLSPLQELSLDSNQIQGSIPQSIQVWKFLTTLNLSNNKLTGSIPDSIGSLGVLTALDLSNNKLSGPIPVEMNSLKLNFLNLSANNLSGSIPQSLENQIYFHSFLSNPGLCSDSNSNSKLNLPMCSIITSSSNKLSRKLIAIFATLGFAVLIGIGVVGSLLLRARTKRKTAGYDETAWKLTSFHKFDFTEYQIIQGLKEENIIGSGGSGKVYKIILNNGNEDQIVAVKRIFVGHVKMDNNLEKNFNAEVNILGQIRHANIVKLLCCISSTDSKLLVYEYMENSSLDRWLYECGRKRKINEKVDVYSFGVILLELITGKRANEGDEYEALADWALRLYLEHGMLEHGMLVGMIDEGIRNDDEHFPDIAAVFELGLSCTAKDPIARPTMKMVLQCLSRYDRTVNTSHNGFGCDQYEEAPLILSKKSSRRKDLSDDFDDKDDDDCSGSFVVHVS